MELKITGILVAVIFAAFVEADPCGQKKSQECLDVYTSASLAQKTEAEKCSDKREVARCLTDVAIECHGYDNNEDILNSIIEMNQVLAEECDGFIERCLDESITLTNAKACLAKSLKKVDEVMGGSEELDMDDMMCTLTSLVGDCIIEDANEKCGQDVTSVVANKIINIMPEDIMEEFIERCYAPGTLEITRRIEDAKKKK